MSDAEIKFATDLAIANVELESFKLSVEIKLALQQVARGDLSAADLIDQLING